jgi:hypothetical protein
MPKSINNGVAIGSFPLKLHRHSAATVQALRNMVLLLRRPATGNSGGEWPGQLCARGKRGGFSLSRWLATYRTLKQRVAALVSSVDQRRWAPAPAVLEPDLLGLDGERCLVRRRHCREKAADYALNNGGLRDWHRWRCAAARQPAHDSKTEWGPLGKCNNKVLRRRRRPTHRRGGRRRRLHERLLRRPKGKGGAVHSSGMGSRCTCTQWRKG